MRQKVSSFDEKKRFILYKGHTGWKIKTRIFGSLLVTFSAFAFAGHANIISVHAADAIPTSTQETGGTSATVAKESDTPEKPVAKNSDDGSTDEGQSSNIEPTGDSTNSAVSEDTEAKQTVGPENGTTSESTTKLAQEVVTQPADTPIAKTGLMNFAAVQGKNATPESETLQSTPQVTSTPDASSADKYPVLSPDKDVSVGADTTQVDLSADQIAGHFTATVENRGGSDQDDDPADNIKQIPIGADGTVALTSNDSHTYYTSPGNPTSMTGHQAAHVSFEHEIDFSHDFSMSGALGIGSKTSGGADSVGFIFAPGDPSKATQGGSGGKLGLQGLNDAFGFVFDEHSNPEYNDPGASRYYDQFVPYVGWRTTDKYGNLQGVSSNAEWKKTSDLTLNRSQNNSLNNFTLDYSAATKTLTVNLGGKPFTRTISDVSSGYSISVAASTGGDWNDYSAKIDKFSYTPKTIPLGVKLVDAADTDALLNNVKVKAIANIGDTVSIFSTQEAADRAVKEDKLDPNLVAVIPPDSAGNIYVIDGDQNVAGETGKVNHIGGDATVGDGTYYSYTVKDGDGQGMTVPVRLAYKAVVTPVDSKTQQPISGLDPVTVVAVAGKPSLVQIPGYTTTKVTLATPTDGEKVAQDNLVIDQGTTGTDATTTTDQSNPIGHYYTGDGKTVDGHEVVAKTTVGTGQSVADDLNQQPLDDDKGNSVVSGQKADDGTGLKTITNTDYYWSSVGNATATDSTDETKPKDSGSVLVPTASTLDYWKGVAAANQNKADTYKQQSQDMYDKFVRITGLTTDQKNDAENLLQSVSQIYTNISTKNGDAKAAFENAETATDASAIYNGGQDGYASLQEVQNLLVSFQADLGALTKKNVDVQSSLATFESTKQTYGDPVNFPVVSFGSGYGTITADELQGLENPNNYYYYNADTDPDGKTPIQTPKDTGHYMFKLTEAGKNYLKNLPSSSSQTGLYVSSMLTINPKDIAVSVDGATVTYGGDANGNMPAFNGNLGSASEDHLDDQTNQSDFEVTDANGQSVSAKQLKVGSTYTISYTKAAQDKLNADKNYNFTSFGTGTLTVIKRQIIVTAQDHGKTYGDPTDPALDLTSDSTKGLVNGDTIKSLNVNLSRAAGENAGKYDITGQGDNSNYTITVDKGTFTIAQKPITVTISSQKINYGDIISTPTYTLDEGYSLVGKDKDSASDLGLTLSTPKDAKNVGQYGITGVASNKGNYLVTVNPGILTIDSEDANPTFQTNEITYGDKSLPEITGNLDTASGDHKLAQSDFEVVDGSGKVMDLSKDKLQVGGTYWIQYTDAAQASLKLDKNYNFNSFGKAKLTINAKDANPTIQTSQITYGDKVLPEITGSLDTVTGDHQLAQSDFEVVDDLGKVMDLSKDKLQVGGTYWIQYTDVAQASLKSDKNYNFKSFGRALLTVNAENASPTVQTNEITYGDKDLPEITGSLDTASGDHQLTQSDFEVVDDLGKVMDLSKDKLQVDKKYWIEYTDKAQTTLKEDKNYNFKSFGKAELTVNSRDANPTVQTNQITYGNQSLPEIVGDLGTVSGDHNLNQSDFEVVDDSGTVMDLSKDKLQVGGTYWIQYTDAAQASLKLDKNYNFESFGKAKLTVNAKDANPTVQTNQITYGNQSLPEIVGNLDTVSVDHQLVQSDFEVVDDSGKVMDLSKDKLQVGGTYWIQYTDAAQASLKLDKNYNFNSFGKAKLTVNAKNANPTVQTNEITYGDKSLPEIVGNLDTVPEDHQLAQSDFEVVDDSGKVMDLSKDKLQVGGTYWIQYTDVAQASLKSDKNYNFESFGKAKLTVNAKNANPTVQTNEITYGDKSLPEITGTSDTVSGDHQLAQSDFEVVDDSGKVMDLSKDKLQVGSTYWIQYTDAAQATLKSDKNYNFNSFGKAKLTVNSRDSNPTVQTNQITYGDKFLPEIVGNLDTLTGDHQLAQSDFEVVDDSGKVMDLSKDKLQVGSTYWIQYTDVAQATLKSDKNYNFNSFGKAKLTVNAKDSNPTVQTNQITYGDKFLPEIVGNLDTLTGDHQLAQSDFEVVDDSGKVMDLSKDKLQVGSTYWIQYTDAAQASLKSDKNYDFKSFGRALLTVNAENASPTVQTEEITYGDKVLPEITGSLDTASDDHNLAQSDFEVVDNSGKIMDLSKDKLQVGSTYWIQYTDAAQASLKSDKNYDFKSFGRALLTVNAENASPTVQTKEITYGDKVLPEITGSLDTASDDHNLAQSDFEVVDNSGKIMDLSKDKLQVGSTYWIQYTDAAQASLKSDKNYDFKSFGRALLTVNAENASPTVQTKEITYGDKVLPEITGSLDTASDDHNLAQSDFEVVDAAGNVLKPEQLQAGGAYWIQYTDKAKAAFEADRNYNFNFGKAELTVTPKDVTPTIPKITVTYGDGSLPEIKGDLGTEAKDHKLSQSDFEIVDTSGNVVKPEDLQAGGDYTIRYTDKAKKALTADKNYNFSSFGEAPLTVDKAAATTTNTDPTKPVESTYGDAPEITRIAKIGPKTIKLNPYDFKFINLRKEEVARKQLQTGTYSIELTKDALNRLKDENPNYDFSKLSFGNLTIQPLKITVQINNQNMYAGDSKPQDTAKLKDGSQLKDGDNLDKLGIKFEDPSVSDVSTVGTYKINAKTTNPNYDVTIETGTLKVLGKDVDSDGNVTITEKDADGNVVKVTKQWNDGSNTVYTNDPANNTKGADEVDKDGKTSPYQTIDPHSGKLILPNSDGSATVVTLDDSGQPVFTHYGVDPDHDGVTSADELKNGTDPLVYNSRGGSAPVIGNGTMVKKNQNIATTTSTVNLYNNEGKLLDSRALGVDSCWFSDEEYTIGGIMYYRVATDEFAKASDVYVYIDPEPALVRVYNNIRGKLVDYQGTKVNRELSPSSEWRTDRIAIINGQQFYRVATNEFVSVDEVYPYTNVNAEVTTNSELPIYNERDEKLDIVLPANGTYKADKIVVMNGVKFYRVATNQFIPVAGVRNYANVDFNVTTDAVTATYNEQGVLLNSKLPANATYKVDREIFVNGSHYYRVATNMFIKVKRF